MNAPETDRLVPTRGTLLRQAEVALKTGRRQLADNFRRAAELVNVPDRMILEIYNALRPHRSTPAELAALAGRLRRDFQAPQCALWIEEAAAIYQCHGLMHNPEPPS